MAGTEIYKRKEGQMGVFIVSRALNKEVLEWTKIYVLVVVSICVSFCVLDALRDGTERRFLWIVSTSLGYFFFW